jgi:hypothetical protein
MTTTPDNNDQSPVDRGRPRQRMRNTDRWWKLLRGRPQNKDWEWPEDPRWSSVRALVITALVTAGMLWVAVRLLKMLAPPEQSESPEASLSLVFVAAGVILILVMCTLTIVFRRLLLTDEQEPMGLPRGSVRAVIALLLIMLFFIAVIFLFNSTRNPTDTGDLRTLKGISPAQFEAIPTDLIQSSTQTGSTTNPLYDVDLLPTSGNSPTSDDIAKQLVTTLATLVTAVAAFYFGAGSVQSAYERPGDDGSATRRRRGKDGRQPRT